MAKKYGKKAQDTVKRAMHERKKGTLRSGGSGRKVTSRKQAIAIGLSEARAAGGKVPKPSASDGRKKKSSGGGRKKSAAASRKSTGTRKTTARKTAGRQRKTGGSRKSKR